MAKPTLQEKQRQIEDEHFAEVSQELIDHHDQRFINRAHEVHGSIRTLSAIAAGMTSQLIRGLMHVEAEKLWRAMGFASFAEYLNKNKDFSFGKTEFYAKRDVLLNSSDEVLDAITGKVSARKVKALLSSGVEFSVENGQLKIGDETVEVSDTRAMAAVIEGVHQSLTERDIREEKKDRTIEALESKISHGEVENEELRRALDSVNQTPWFQRAMMKAVGAILELTEAVGQLDDAEKQSRAADDLKTFAGLYFKLSDSYGVKKPLTDDRELELKLAKPVEAMTEAEKKETFLDRATAAVMDDDDFGEDA